MKKIITESTLRNMIKKHIAEALKYDKERKQYFPDYTGEPHSDAGKFVSNNRDDFNYSRNDYKWSDPKKQQRFQDLQWDKDLEIDPADPDSENEGNAEEYLMNHKPDTVVEHAVEELRYEFENMIDNFLKNAAEKYPIFKKRYYMSDLMYKLRDILEEYDY